jgi:hypothetical protein
MTGADMLIERERGAERRDILLICGASILVLLSGCSAARPSSEMPVTGLLAFTMGETPRPPPQAFLDDPAPLISVGAEARRRSFDALHDRVLCGGQCPSSSELGLSTGPGPDFEITLSRRCPAYVVTLRADGTVVYEGHRWVKVHGRVVDHVAPKDVDGLVRRFEDGFEKVHPLDLWKLRTESFPELTLTLVRGDRSLKVDADVLGVAAKIDRIAGTERWTRCGSSPDVPCDEPAATRSATLFAGGCPRAR